MKINFLNKKALVVILSGTISMISLTGCAKDIPEISDYDTMITTELENDNLYNKNDLTVDNLIDLNDLLNGNSIDGVTQIIDIPGEDFDLVVDYNYDLPDYNWSVNEDNHLSMSIKTTELEEGTEVYVSNIHTKTGLIYYDIISIWGTGEHNGRYQYATDYVLKSNSVIGSLIKENISCEKSLLINPLGRINSLNGTSINELWLEEGIYGNKISSVIELLIHKSDMKEGTYELISVPTDVGIKFLNCFEEKEIDNIKYKQYYFNDGVLFNSINYKKIDSIPNYSKKNK